MNFKLFLKYFLALAVFFAPTISFAKPKIVYDLDSGIILAGKDIDQQWHPASLTKIMTGYLAFIALTERRDIKLDTKITLSKNAAKQPPSKLGIGAGRQISFERALQALFVRSNNDIAVGIAERLGGSEQGFVNMMNDMAVSLGMSRTHFVNPHGLHDKKQVTTARDMAKLSHAIVLEFPQYARFFNMKYFKIGKKNLRNRNGLLRDYQGADGMKTGFVCASGYNLVASASRSGKRIIAIMMGGKTVKSRDDQVKSLLDQGFGALKAKSHLENATIYNAEMGRLSLPFNMRPIACPVKKRKK